jgi:hypothetical protein
MNEVSTRIEDQVGPCGILCGACPLGNGAVAENASRTRKHISDCQIPMWAPFVPGGEAIDWAAVDQGLEWMQKNACCAGCNNGGGPPDCTIRICARERGTELCSSCEDLDGCNRFEWLKEHSREVKENLKKNRGLSKEEYLKKMRSSYKLPGTLL